MALDGIDYGWDVYMMCWALGLCFVLGMDLGWISMCNVCGILCHQLAFDERSERNAAKTAMLWPLFLLPCLVRTQSTHPALSLDTPLSLSASNFSTSTSTPLLFSLPSSAQLTISVALCAPPSSSAPRVFVSNSSDSQVIPGPSGGLDVFEVTLSGLGLGNLTLDVSDSAGLLAVYGGTTSDNLEIGVSQGGMSNQPAISFSFSQTHHPS